MEIRENKNIFKNSPTIRISLSPSAPPTIQRKLLYLLISNFIILIFILIIKRLLTVCVCGFALAYYNFLYLL